MTERNFLTHTQPNGYLGRMVSESSLTNLTMNATTASAFALLMTGIMACQNAQPVVSPVTSPALSSAKTAPTPTPTPPGTPITDASPALSGNSWTAKYTQGGQDKSSNFKALTITFGADGVITVVNSGSTRAPVTGGWRPTSGGGIQMSYNSWETKAEQLLIGFWTLNPTSTDRSVRLDSADPLLDAHFAFSR
jgi:hypothetical protein